MQLKLTVSDICKFYGGSAVLQGCSYSFEQSGVYVLMGKNGSGKSTFLRIAALLEMPDAGNVAYFSNGIAQAHDIELRRKITLVLPKIGMFNSSVYHNAAYGLKVRGISGQAQAQRVSEVLNFVGLRHKIRQNALTLSSGETQRLGIARAIAIEPDVLFLDEPTAFIDDDNTRIIENIILELKKEQKTVIIMTTHDHLQAKRLGDAMILMNKGQLHDSLLSPHV